MMRLQVLANPAPQQFESHKRRPEKRWRKPAWQPRRGNSLRSGAGKRQESGRAYVQADRGLSEAEAIPFPEDGGGEEYGDGSFSLRYLANQGVDFPLERLRRGVHAGMLVLGHLVED